MTWVIDASGPIQALRGIGERLQDATEPLTAVLTMALADARMSVETQGEALGDIWEPMSDLTPVVAKVLYQKERTPTTLMRDTGGLLASLSPGGAGNVLAVGPTEGVAGSELARAGWQQRGTARTFHVLQGSGYSVPGIPERPFLLWRPSKLDEYAGVFAEHLMGPEEVK